jgi:hypothetical protein
MLLVTNRYYAKPGMADAVLQTRRRMDALYRRLHLSAGQTFVRHQQPGGAPNARTSSYIFREDGPDVIWQCVYESREARERTLHVIDSDPEISAEAEAIMAEQRTQVTRFDREDSAPSGGVGARGRSRSPAGLAGCVRWPRRAT